MGRCAIFRGLPAALACVLGLSPAFAQILDPLLEEQRRRALEERTNALGTFQPGAGATDPGPAQAAGGPCFQIDQLNIDGVTLLTPDEIATLTEGAVPACMQGADIQAVMRKLDNAYADRGYITTKTYIPPQNLQGGSLTLKVLEGRVEGVFLIDDVAQIDTARGRRQLATAFPVTPGALFQLRDFEQGLDQMNRLASVEATLKLQPGETPGGSYVIVQRVQNDRFRGYVRLDNQGSAGTGRNKLSLETEFDDLLGLNDAWSFSLGGTQNTNSLSLSGSVPLRYWTFSTDLGYSEYLTPLTAASELFGTSHTASLKASRVLRRNQTSTTAVRFGLRTHQSDRYINGLRLTPQNLSVASIGINHLRLSNAARNSFDLDVSIGLTGFGANIDDPLAGTDTPRAQFFKVEGGWQRQGALGQAGTLVTDLRLQWSPNGLYSAEQMSLGSLSTVRGYEVTEASGDIGAFVRTDLYLAPTFWQRLPERIADHMQRTTQVHLFADAGLTYDRARDVTEHAAGLGVGVSYASNRFTASGILGVPLILGGEGGISSPVVQVRFDIKTW